MINSNALQRAFVPRRVEVITNDSFRLARIGSPDFKPAELAVVEEPVELPEVCRGIATITDEIPTRINISASMETAGMLVLSDLWDKGWIAVVNGARAPVLRANHAVRGVVLPQGQSMVEFRYEPESFVTGSKLFAAAFVLLTGLFAFSYRRQSGDDAGDSQDSALN
jgi:hypothetical protein